MARTTWRAQHDKELAEHRAEILKEASSDGKGLLSEIRRETSTLGFHSYFFICLLAAATPCALTTILWSSMGWGEQSIEILVDNQALAKFCAGGVSFLILVLYLLDFFCPPHLPGQYLTFFNKDSCLGIGIMSLIGLGLVGASLLSAKDHPTLPALVTVLCGPVLLASIRLITRPKLPLPKRSDSADRRRALEMLALIAGDELDARNFYAGVMTALLTSGCFTILMWMLWAINTGLDLSDITLGDKEKETVYIQWLSPFIAGFANIVCGCIAQLRVKLSKEYEDTDKSKTDLVLAVGTSEEVNSREKVIANHLESIGGTEAFAQLAERDQKWFKRQHFLSLVQLSKTMKVVACIFLTFLGGFYVAAELVAADSQIAQLVLGFVGIALLCFIAFLFASFGRLMSAMKEWFMQCPLGRLAVGMSQNDWVRAAIICSACPVVPMFLALSALNQLVRRCRGLYRRMPPKQAPRFSQEAEGAPHGANGQRPSCCSVDKVNSIKVGKAPQDQILTERVMEQLQMVSGWNWMSIMPKIYVEAFGFLCYILAPRLLNIFLSWLNELLRTFPFGITVLLTMLAGATCFLLPPVPGMPVYLFTGLIIVATSPVGFWTSCVMACTLGLCLKLVACSLQQKLIGEALGSSITIKSQVGVNKPFFRAVEAVLRKPGLSLGKVSILCGGPDWPTSVLCGILRCSLLEMELGTLPVVVFIIPCTLCGSFYLRKDESEAWSNAMNLMVALVAAINMVFGVCAMWAIQDELDANHWEVTKPLVKNVELDWLDFRSAQLAESCVIQWSDLPCLVRCAALLGALVEVGVGHLLYWRASACFGSFGVTDDIKTLVWYGEDGIFKNRGVMTLGVAMGGFFGYAILTCFLRRKQAGPFKAKAERLKDFEGPWKEERLAEALKAETQAHTGNGDVPSGKDIASVRSSKLSQLSAQVKRTPTVRKMDKE